MTLWIKRPTRWQEAMAHNYFSNKTLAVQNVPQAIVLPPIKPKNRPNDYVGGCVCNAQQKWLAGLTRAPKNAPFEPDCWGFLDSYKVHPQHLSYRKEEVIFGGVLIHHFGHCLIESFNRIWWLLQNPHEKRKVVFVYASPWAFGGGGSF